MCDNAFDDYFFFFKSLSLSLCFKYEDYKGGGTILLILLGLETGVGNYFRFDWLRLIVGDTVLSGPIPF